MLNETRCKLVRIIIYWSTKSINQFYYNWNCSLLIFKIDFQFCKWRKIHFLSLFSVISRKQFKGEKKRKWRENGFITRSACKHNNNHISIMFSNEFWYNQHTSTFIDYMRYKKKKKERELLWQMILFIFRQLKVARIIDLHLMYN